MQLADQIREQRVEDPDRVANIRQEAGLDDFLAVGSAMRIIQLNVEGMPAAKRYPGHCREAQRRHHLSPRNPC